MGFLDNITSKLKGNQSSDFRKEVEKYKTKYVNLSKDELRAKLVNPKSEAEKVGVTELLYGVGMIGAAIPIVSSLYNSLKDALDQNKGKMEITDEADSEDESEEELVEDEDETENDDAENDETSVAEVDDLEEETEEDSEDEEEDEEDDDDDDFDF